MDHLVKAAACALLLVSIASAGPLAPTTLAPSPAVTASSQIWGDPALPGTPAARELEERGYVREELFLSGTANIYGAGAQNALPVERAGVAYTTRLVVLKPRDAKRFSGNVQLVPFHPQQGTPGWNMLKNYVLAHGDAYVGVLIGGDRTSRESKADPPTSAPWVIKWFDPVRYAQINWPDDDGIAWDVFAQTAAKIRALDGPLAPLKVQRIYASGWSYTGSFLRTFINEGFHEAARIDGYLLGISASNYIGGYVPINSHDAQTPTQDPRRRNRPIDAPVIELMSENESVSVREPQTPDNDRGRGRHRLYQAAGLTHTGGGRTGGVNVVQQQVEQRMAQLGTPRPERPAVERCAYPPSDIDMSHFGQAALANLDRWARTGSAPGRAPRMQLDAGFKQSRDANGNVQSGLRSALIEVPLARYGEAEGPGCAQRGAFMAMNRVPFSSEQLARLYPGGKAEYLKRFDAAVDRMVKQRFILAGDGATEKSEARAAAEMAFAPQPTR